MNKMTAKRTATVSMVKKALKDIKIELISYITFPFNHKDAPSMLDDTIDYSDELKRSRIKFINRVKNNRLTPEDELLIQMSEISIWEATKDSPIKGWDGTVVSDHYPVLSLDADFYNALNYGYSEFPMYTMDGQKTDPFNFYDCIVRHRLAQIGCDYESYDRSIKTIYCDPTTREERLAEIAKIEKSFCSKDFGLFSDM